MFAPGLDGQAIVLRGTAARRPTACGRGPPPTQMRTPASTGSSARSAGSSAELAARTPPDIESPGLGDALAGLQLGRTFRGLGRQDARTITRVLPMAIADFVAESFETDALQAAIAWRGIQYTAMGPWSAGTTAVLLADSAGNDGGAAGQTVYARGGPGALVAALEARRAACGVEFRTGAEVAAITSRDGRATGVVLAGGEELAARAVVAGIDPKRTLTRLADPVAIGPSLLWRAGNIRTPGTVAKVNLVLAGPPRFTAAGSDESLIRGRILVAPGIDAVGARPRRRQVRPLVRPADHGGDDPVAGRPVAGRRRPGRHPGDERDRPVHAVRPARRHLGRAPRGVRRPGRPDARRLCARVWPRW